MSGNRLSPQLRYLRRHPVRIFRRAAASIAVLLAAAYFIWPSALGGRVQLVVVSGNSMEPTYHSKDLLYVRIDRSIEVGEPAVYRMPNASGTKDVMIVHRIVAQDPDGKYLLRGDNRSSNDAQPVSPDDIIGVPVFNLGPLPTRLLAAIPLYGTLLFGVCITWMLWPRKRTPHAISDTAESADVADEVPVPERLQVVSGTNESLAASPPLSESLPLSETA